MEFRKYILGYKIPWVFILVFFLTTNLAKPADHYNALKTEINSVRLISLSNEQSANYPLPIIAQVQVVDQYNRMVHGLANAEKWLKPNEYCDRKLLVSEVWQPLKTYIKDNSSYPPNPEIREFQIKEIINDPDSFIYLVLVLDINKDVGENELEKIREIVKTLIIGLPDNFYISLVANNTHSNIFQRNGELLRLEDEANRNALINLINGIIFEGVSNLPLALDNAVNSLVNINEKGDKNIIVITADGNAIADRNVITQVAQDNIIKNAVADSITINIIHSRSAGSDTSEREQQDFICRNTGGSYRVLADENDIQTAFIDLCVGFGSYYAILYPPPFPCAKDSWWVFDVTVKLNNLSCQGTKVYPVSSNANDLAIRKTAVTCCTIEAHNRLFKIANLGETFHYNIEVTNQGNQSITDVQVSDFMPNVLDNIGTFSPSPTSESFEKLGYHGYNWYFDVFAAGRQEIITFNATIPNTLSETDAMIINEARLLSNLCDSDTTNNSSNDTVYVRMDYSDPLLVCPDPSTIFSPSDTVRISGSSFAPLKNWELWATWPNGSTQLLSQGTIVYPIDQIELYVGRLPIKGNVDREEIQLEWWTTDLFNQARSVDCAITVEAKDYWKLTHNEYRPNRDLDPFNITVSVGTRRPIDLKIFDISGRLIKDFGQFVQEAGEVKYPWDVLDDKGRAVGSGIYVVALDADPLKGWKKFVIIR
jgi:uncharacterized repeat protein (TIGR01451 family)